MLNYFVYMIILFRFAIKIIHKIIVQNNLDNNQKKVCEVISEIIYIKLNLLIEHFSNQSF